MIFLCKFGARDDRIGTNVETRGIGGVGRENAVRKS